jgi:hypothetical protein
VLTGRRGPAAPTLEPPPPAPSERARPGIPNAAAVAAFVALLALAVWARRPGYMLSAPLWLDEGWVAASVHAPVGRLLEVTSSSPVGFTALLRLIPRGEPEWLRIVPLVLSTLTVVPAWLLGRRLGGLAGGVLLGLAAALAPAVVARHDLKQYTAEALVAVGLLAAVAWAEAAPSRRRLAWLAGLAVLSALFANAAVFTAGGAFGALAALALIDRDKRRLTEVATAGLAVAAVTLPLLLLTVLPSNGPTMQRYWRNGRIPVDQGAAVALETFGARTAKELGRAGFGPWPVALALAGAGVAGLWRAGSRAAALMLPLTFLAMVAGGVTGRFPFLVDPAQLPWSSRISVFFTALLTVVAAAGLLAIVQALVRRRAAAPLAAGVLAVAGLMLGSSAAAAARSPIPPVKYPGRYAENVRAQVEYVLANRRPGDYVFVTGLASFNFSMLWPDRPNLVYVPGPVRFRVGYAVGSGVGVGQWPVGDPAVERVWVIAAHVKPDFVPEPPSDLPVSSMARPLPDSPLHLIVLDPGRQR